jgi:ketosteroid isomerase-like protein
MNMLARNKEIVQAFYDGAVRGDFESLKTYVHADFVCQAPEYLPWGGTIRTAKRYFNEVLPLVGKYLDFKRLSFPSITAEEDRVSVIIHVGVTDTPELIQVSDNWVVRDEKLRAIWVAYFEPWALVDQIRKATGLKPDAPLGQAA